MIVETDYYNAKHMHNIEFLRLRFLVYQTY